MNIDLMDVLAVDWVRVSEGDREFPPAFHRRIVLHGDVADQSLRGPFRDPTGAMWMVTRTLHDSETTTVYMTIVD